MNWQKERLRHAGAHGNLHIAGFNFRQQSAGTCRHQPSFADLTWKKLLVLVFSCLLQLRVVTYQNSLNKIPSYKFLLLVAFYYTLLRLVSSVFFKFGIITVFVFRGWLPNFGLESLHQPKPTETLTSDYVPETLTLVISKV